MNGSKTVPQQATARHLHGVAARLALPKGWTAADLSAALERDWGPVVWLPLPDGITGVCGLQFVRQRGRVVFHQQPDSPSRHRWVLAHAAAHVVLGHGDTLTLPEGAALLTGVDSGDGTTAEQVRSSLDGAAAVRAEQEADMLADLLLARSAQSRRGGPCSRCPPAGEFR